MNWRRQIIRTGSAMSLLAWSFGAVLLGLGNAVIGPVDIELSQLDRSPIPLTADGHRPVNSHLGPADAKHPPHTHLTAAKDDAAQSPGVAPHHQPRHHDPTGPLPAHCLFCLDGLSPLAVPTLDLFSTPGFAAAGNLRLATLSREFSHTTLSPPVRAPPLVRFS
jgi:hypothetical protein